MPRARTKVPSSPQPCQHVKPPINNKFQWTIIVKNNLRDCRVLKEGAFIIFPYEHALVQMILYILKHAKLIMARHPLSHFWRGF